jgi:hypothetical protein
MEEIEEQIRNRFNEEETIQDKEYYLNEIISRTLKELYQELEELKENEEESD